MMLSRQYDTKKGGKMMELKKLLQMQRELDQRIIKEKGLEGQDLVPNTFVALQVELAEFANEARWFKHWSSKQKSIDENKLLEEFVDALHFFLSIAIQKRWEDALYIYVDGIEDIRERGFDGGLTGIYLEMIYYLNKSYFEIPTEEDNKKNINAVGFDQKTYWFRIAWHLFITIGMVGFGFTWEQICDAYLKKNQVNHQRQDSGVY